MQVTLTPIEAQFRREAREAVEQDIRREFEAEAKRAIAAAEDDAERRHRDDLATYMKATEADIDFRVEAESEARWQARRDAYVDRMETVKERAELAEAKAACLAEGLDALIRALLPQEDRYRALGRHCSVESLDMVKLGPALAHIGLRLGFKATESAHAITLRLPHGAQMMHLVSLKRNLPLSVDDRREETAIDAPAQ